VVFICSSNGGHVALQLDERFAACWLILASSLSLSQQISCCTEFRRRGITLLMAICENDRFFGGVSSLWDLARQMRFYAVWVHEVGHCRESWRDQAKAAEVVRAWLGET